MLMRQPRLPWHHAQPVAGSVPWPMAWPRQGLHQTAAGTRQDAARIVLMLGAQKALAAPLEHDGWNDRRRRVRNLVGRHTSTMGMILHDRNLEKKRHLIRMAATTPCRPKARWSPSKRLLTTPGAKGDEFHVLLKRQEILDALGDKIFVTEGPLHRQHSR